MSAAVYYAEINLMCIIVLAIILFSFLGINIKTLKARTFVLLVIGVIAFSISDLVAGTLRGLDFPGARIILWISNISYFLSMIYVAIMWLMFSMSMLKNRIYKSVLFVTIGFGILLAIFNVTTPWHGLLFDIDADNLYFRGPLFWITSFAVYPSYFLGILFLYKSKAETKEKVAVLIYPIFPVLASLFQVFFYGSTTAQVGFTASVVLIYVLLQGIEVNEQRIKAKVFDELSRTDTLTGLNNRRSYIKMIDNVSSSSWVGVIFLDLNGLKEINDEKGHEEGDQLIRNFSILLKSLFKNEEIYRISGDEFVVLTENKDEFDDKINKLIEINNNVASYGYSSGPGKDIMINIRNAELIMYENKSNYYITSGKNRRR